MNPLFITIFDLSIEEETLEIEPKSDAPLVKTPLNIYNDW